MTIRAVCIIVMLVCFAQISAPCATKHEQYPPLPEKVKAAKTIYLENQSTYAGVFDHLYEPLAKWGRWKVVGDASRADLRLIMTRTSPTGERRHFNPRWFLVITEPGKDAPLLYISADMAIGSEKSFANHLVKLLRERIENAAE